MSLIGKLLLAVGFFGAAFVTVRHPDAAGLRWDTIDWPGYTVFLSGGIIGVVLMRLSARKLDTHDRKLNADRDQLRSALDSLTVRLSTVLDQDPRLGVYEVHGWIDEHLVEDLARFVEARESMITLFGLQEYAAVMSEFAISERRINRSWSASADGYIDEVWSCLEQARQNMLRAKELFDNSNAAAA